jgi:Tfp pilus tip-associated adhesin PilY1
MHTTGSRASRRRLAHWGVAGALALASLSGQAALTDISSVPLASTTAAQVKPNIMLLMDTSGSMGWSHMPDEVEDVANGQRGFYNIGYKAYQCNALYYNPNTTYFLPRQADGTFFPQPPFNAARYDPFDTSSSTTTDLTSGFRAYDTNTLKNTGYNDTAQAAYYYLHTGGTGGTGTLVYNASPCWDPDNGAPNTAGPVAASDGGTWTRVLVSATSGPAASDERANFAIWYTYYRTRILMIKTAASLAFTPLTDSFRVGFITVNPKYPNNVPATNDSLSAPINPDKYLAIADFNTAQRSLWFDKLFSQKPGGSSPTREGLARVGRHYAGQHDGINTGMPEDPVQYSCQQNFTIMTTDGYWNDQAETVGAGPVRIDGTTPVALPTDTTPLGIDPDGDLSNPLSPRPIFDGMPDTTITTTDKNNSFVYATCGTFFSTYTTQALKSTNQVVATTSQNLQSTTQVLQTTAQNLQSTVQNLQSTTQTRLTTTQNLQSTVQNLQNTNQNLASTSQIQQSTLQTRIATSQTQQSTFQNLQTSTATTQTTTTTQQMQQIARQSTVQTLQSTVQNLQSQTNNVQSTSQKLQSTVQNRQSTNQNRQSTTQTLKGTTQNLQSTTQNLKATTQMLQTTHQSVQSTSQTTQSTSQTLTSTSQLTIQTSQVRQSTSQLSSCDASTELCTPVPVGSCTPSGNITCETNTTGPTLVASCTPQSPNAGNNYLTITCSTTSSTPTGTASCAAQGATAANNYTTTTCNTVNTGSVPTGSCNPATASAANNYTATTCNTVTTGPTFVATCTPAAESAGNNWTTTTCGTATTSNVPVQTCTPATATAGNNWTTTSCGSLDTNNVPVSSCTAAGPSAGNSWTTVSCNPNNTAPTPVASCVASAGWSGNGWVTTSCSTNNTTNVPVATCTASAASAANSWTATTCPAPVTTGPTPVSSCSAVAASAGNSWTATTCTPNNTTNVPVATCTASAATAGNNWTTTTCPAPVVTTNVPVATCTAAAASAGNSWTTTTCPAPVTTTNVPVASCTAAAASAGNSWTTTTCPAPITTGPTAVQTCTAAAAAAGNNYTATTCAVNSSLNVPVQTCTASGATAGNGWVTTTCSNNNTTNVPVSSCTAASAAAGNAWTTTTCTPNNTTNVAVASCTAAAASAGNNWTTTTCPAPTIVQPWTNVQTCTPVAPTAGNGYTQTLCQGVGNTINVAACVPQAPNAGNNWTTITCGSSNVTVPVNTCTPQTGNAGNNWVTITCGTNNTGPTFVQTCTAAAKAAGNNWTQTTCTPVTTGPTPTSSCTPVAATAGNNWTTTTCPNVPTGPTGVASCTPVAASAGNNWTATTCNTVNNNNVPVVTCTAAAASAGNAWTTTTCPAPITTSNVPVATCTAAAATAANSYTSTSCPAPATTTNVPVATCTAAAASAANAWTTTTCPAPIVTGPTGVSSCTPIAASAGNNWTATTCAPNNTTNVPVASCTPSTANAGNGWTDTTCGNANTTNVPVQTCTASGPTLANGWTTTTCSTNNTTNVGVISCTPGASQVGNSWTTTTCTQNNTTNVPVSSCTASGPNAGNGWTTTTCGTAGGTPVGVDPAVGCTPTAPSAANNWTTTTCPAAIVTGPTPVATCVGAAPSAANSWVATTCSNNNSGVTVVTSCNPAAANAGNNYTATICTPMGGKKIQYTLTTTVSVQGTSGGVPAGPPTVTQTTDPIADLDGVCYAPGAEPALPSPNPQSAGITAGPTAPAPCTGWPCTIANAAVGARSLNSLADVAQYYYITDLRPGMTDDVLGVGNGPEDDRVRWQHMTTFSVALGVSGTLKYRPDYKSGSVTTGDFADIRTGVKTWPLWPDPSLDTVNNKTLWNDPRSIDDFWHAAVNGRGTYFSAANPTSVINGIADALAGIQGRVASGSAAGTSNLQPVPGDNFVYVANYSTLKWIGDIQAHTIDTTTGVVSTTVNWSAQALLDQKTGSFCDNRTIWLMRPGATNNMVPFTANTSVCDASMQPSGGPTTGLNATELNNFGALNVSLLSQYPNMTDGTAGTVDQRTPASGANLVNFLRGQRGLENFVANDVTRLYRKRDAVLGDIIGGQPVYVRAPFATYQDAGYAAFKSANVNRVPMVYAPANDGMLHAFYAGASATDALRGQEAWAIIPTSVLPNLWKLADAGYGNNHQFFTDGTPTVSDAYDATNTTWKTVLVAGLNAGGKGYYAVDVTDPATPKTLWEFKWGAACYSGTPVGSDCHLGYTFGRPVITKLTNGTWVVLVTSGYNNVNAPSGAGDGQGYLYVLDAFTGQILYKIGTGVGDATTPSGLAQINNYIDNGAVTNTTTQVYGGDMLGNIWRFDINDTILPAGREATLLGVATDPGGSPQPITTKPELAEYNGQPMVFIGTGRLLGASDLADQQVQSIYGFIDKMTGSPVYANLRAALAPRQVTQHGSGATATRTVDCPQPTFTAAQCALTDGWVVDLPDPGERINVDIQLALGTIVAPSNVPQSNACNVGGYSWLNQLFYADGLAVSSAPDIGGGGGGSRTTKLVSTYATGNVQALTVGITVIQLPGIGGSAGATKGILVDSSADVLTPDIYVDVPPPKGKRISWREVVR